MTDSLYLNSEDVHVFPYGSSRASDPLARVLNERNITTLVKNLTDEHSYVLFYKDGLIKFVIAGYYFECNISDITDKLESNKSLWAGINVGKDETDQSNYLYLTGGDVDTETTDAEGNSIYNFQGIQFFDSDPGDVPNENLTFKLQLLDEDRDVPSSSWIKYDPTKIKSALDNDNLNNLSDDVDDLNTRLTNLIGTGTGSVSEQISNAINNLNEPDSDYHNTNSVVTGVKQENGQVSHKRTDLTDLNFSDVQSESYATNILGVNSSGKLVKSSKVSITNGGTGASTAESARTNLGVYSKSEVDNAINSINIIYCGNASNLLEPSSSQ